MINRLPDIATPEMGGNDTFSAAPVVILVLLIVLVLMAAALVTVMLIVRKRDRYRNISVGEFAPEKKKKRK